MDETTALIYRGINLVKELEANMSNLVHNQPDVLISKCEEIIRVFTNVKERHNMNPSGGGFQEWFRINSNMHRSNVMELDHAQHYVTGDLEVVEGQTLHPSPMTDSSRGTSLSSSQRQRGRKDEVDKRTIRVGAPQMGNIDVPPEDGFTWRKYGQKEILGAKFPRAYYRCTHQKMYNCPAKKQVQRLDEDPFVFEVTYREDHQCYLTSTAPSINPSSLEINNEMNIQEVDTSRGFNNLPIMPLQSTHGAIPLGPWLSMNINNQSSGEGTSSRGHFGTNSNNNNALGPPPPSSAVRYGRDVVDYQNVADLADVMFNSGSSSNNSMELIFSTMEENISNYNIEETKE